MEQPGIQLGFEGLLRAGWAPQDAWEHIRTTLAHDEAQQRILRILAVSAQGQRALAYSAERWRMHGFAPPWEGLDGLDLSQGDKPGEGL